MLQKKSTKVISQETFKRRRVINLSAKNPKSNQQQYREFLATLYKIKKSKKRKKQALTALVGVSLVTVISFTVYFSSTSNFAHGQSVLGEKEILQKLEPSKDEEVYQDKKIILPPR